MGPSAKVRRYVLSRLDSGAFERFDLALVGNPINPSLKLEKAKNRTILFHNRPLAAERSIA